MFDISNANKEIITGNVSIGDSLEKGGKKWIIDL